MRNHKIRVFKWSDSWVIQCPRCIYSCSFVAMASTHREAISKVYKHLHSRHAANINPTTGAPPEGQHNA